VLYEIGVYNKRVRDCIRGGDDWNNNFAISDKFEDVNYFEFQATSIEEVERRVEREFPKALGYVLDYIKTVKVDT
jgi:hypothetical protein|tara:strand:- start:2139 stop:2363 length:225 start_codon:yes stop_codon:yes gene_type:complete